MEHDISLRERIRLNLVAAMERAGMNQVQLAKKLGISKGTVNNWIRGNNSPDVDIVPDVCSVLEISIIELFTSLDSSVISPPGLILTEDEQHLIRNYRSLNEEGQYKLFENSDDLASMPKYKKSNKFNLDSKEA